MKRKEVSTNTPEPTLKKTKNALQVLTNKDLVIEIVGHQPGEPKRTFTSLATAAKNGYMAVVEYQLRKRKDTFKKNELAIPMSCAARNGHLEIFKLLDEQKVPMDDHYLHYVVRSVGSSGDMRLVEYLGKDYEHRYIGARNAAMCNHLDVLEYWCPEPTPAQANDLLASALIYGHLGIVEWCCRKGAIITPNNVLNAAAIRNVDLFRYIEMNCVGKFNVDDCIEEACHYGRHEIVRYLMEHHHHSISRGIMKQMNIWLNPCDL